MDRESQTSLVNLHNTTGLTLLLTSVVIFNQLLLVVFIAWKFHLVTDVLSHLIMAME